MENKGEHPHPAPEPGFMAPQQHPHPNQVYPQIPQQIPQTAPPRYDQINSPVMTTTIIQQSGPVFGPKPTMTVCHNCRKEVLSEVKHVPGTKTHLFALLLCLVFWPCVCVPYFCDSCQNTNHYCPSCKQYLGMYHQQ